MPEGDTVWRTARRLHEALAGRRLSRAELRVPRHATASLAGLVVQEVASRGKHILLRTESELTLHTHLGMEGSWQVAPVSTRWPGPREPVRAVLATDDALAIGRRLTRVDLLRTSEEDTVVGHLGPDLLSTDWDDQTVPAPAAAQAAARLAAHPERTIGEALLDQRNLAGIGTIYRAELLFLRGVHPETPVAGVGDMHRLVTLARELLWANRERPEQATTGNLRKGQRHWVYGRAGEPCRRCGTTIRTGRLGPAGRERVTFWCLRCQPPP